MDTKVIESLKNREETLWINEGKKQIPGIFKRNGFGYNHMKAAQNRFMRFMPYLEKAFPETADRKGNIESLLIPIPKMQEALGIPGKVYLKDDAHLPVAGSVKARGGIHEVLKIAETVMQKNKMLYPGDDYTEILEDEFKELFGKYTIQVGSTGNLGISIGRTAARLGFKAVVHMSSDAKQWKKDLLRSEGVTVKEYEGDYSAAVAQGRADSAADPMSFFVDDENSEDLFFGYSTAAFRVKMQLMKAGITVDEDHPLFLYLPCGVGGAPGGITFGMKMLFLDHAHCFFAEPTEAPCFTLGMASEKQGEIAVQEIGLTGKTIADGLAVGRASGFVCSMMEPLVSGSFTVADERLPEWQKQLQELEGIHLEASACAGFKGLVSLKELGAEYLEKHGITEERLQKATHIVWGTGGGLEEIYG